MHACTRCLTNVKQMEKSTWWGLSAQKQAPTDDRLTKEHITYFTWYTVFAKKITIANCCSPSVTTPSRSYMVVVHTTGPHGTSPCSFRPPVSVTAFFEIPESESGSCFRRERRLGLDVTWEVLGNEPPVFAGDDARPCDKKDRLVF